MKILLGIIIAALLAFFGWQALLRPEAPEARKAQKVAASVQKLHPGQFEQKTDAEAIFRKTLWRAPEPGDRVLHAERREWTENPTAGISRWQTFLAIDASPALLRYLREENAFGARPAAKITLQQPPDWFPTAHEGYDLFAAGSLALLYSRTDSRIFLADAGKGLTPALAALPPPVPAPTAAQPTGRLPATPPPSPTPAAP